MITRIVIFIFMLSLTHSLFGQKQSFDIFTYSQPPGWSEKSVNGDVQLTFQKGNNWCVIGLYAGTPTTGSAIQDFEADWKDLTRSYTITGEVEREEPYETKGFQMVKGIAPGLYQQQSITITMITFSDAKSRSTLVMVHNDKDNQLDSNLEAFMSGLSVNTPQVDTPSTAQPTSGTSSYAQPTMGVMAYLASSVPPTPNAQPVTRATVTEGWSVEATNEYIQYSNPEIKVIQYFFIPPEDPNSNTDDEDLFWRKFLQQYFIADRYVKFPNDPYDFLNRVQSASGYVLGKADKRQYYLVWIVSINMGCSFLAISNSEAQYQKYFSHPNKLVDMDRLNYFQVSSNDIQGSWADTGFAGAQLYNVNTGASVGMSVAANSEQWIFKGKIAEFHAQGATGMVGNLKTFVVDRSGTFVLSGFDLAVTMINPERKLSDYYCGFVAGKGGLFLKLQDKKYTAQIDFLTRQD